MSEEWTAPDSADSEDDVQEIEEETADLEEVIQEALDAVEQSERNARVEESQDGSDIESMEAEIADLRDRAVRTLADFDNFRKRTERERAEERRYASLELSRDILVAVDNLERALAADGDLEDLRAGVQMTLRQMQEVLGRFGVRRVEASPGTAFDPAVHEAVTRQEDVSVAEPVVAEELQVGYRMHERLLRPAMVAVAMPPESSEKEE